MGPIDALWHVLNLLAPALGVGLLASAAAKLLWRRDLKTIAWARLTVWACSMSALALLGGLMVFGRDGKMATYGAMLAACALSLWWHGFLARR